MFRTAEISFANASGYSTGQAIEAMEAICKRDLPQGFSYEWTGTAYQEKAAGSSTMLIFGMALLFVFLFLAAQYESWTIPFGVLLGLPIGIFGAFFALAFRYLVLGSSTINDVYAQIGVVMLLGLAAKNAILIVEYAMMKRKDGFAAREAAVEGAKLRFRPILMTSFAFILGVVPLVISSGAGAASRKTMGTAVFGGMMMATLLGVFIIPVLYTSIELAMDWLKRKQQPQLDPDDMETKPGVSIAPEGE
jgi:HAE1 family hydrophobic/amphiphilic exporter-1/multidrug efflux pump